MIADTKSGMTIEKIMALIIQKMIKDKTLMMIIVEETIKE